MLLKEFIKSDYIKNTPISKKDLQNLWKMIVGNNQTDLNSTILATVNMLKIEENSIEAFLAHEEIPDRLIEYTIRSYNLDPNHKSAISLNASDGPFSFLYITGCDEAWVIGKFQQIETFMNIKLSQSDEKQKSDRNIKAVINKEKSIEAVSPTTVIKLDENSKIAKLAQIGIIETNINRVFVVHGHDDEMKLDAARTLEKLDLTPIILHEQPDGNKTIIEKFEQYSDVGFAIIILSPDDFG
jgi:small nuclear ribonucleoprotein (snRNP)-like protein